MTRVQAFLAAAALLVGVGGLVLWDRWGALVWLEGAIAYCF